MRDPVDLVIGSRPRRLHQSGRLASVLLGTLCSAGCDSTWKPGERWALAGPSPIASPNVVDEHAAHDCREAHPEQESPTVAKATRLSPEARNRLTTLRISAHRGSVILRKQGASWVAAGQDGCVAPPSRIERALDNLAILQAVPTSERVAAGSSFELQIVALIGEERILSFDLADRNDEGDLIHLGDDAAFRVRGLDRNLWSPRPRDWCEGS